MSGDDKSITTVQTDWSQGGFTQTIDGMTPPLAQSSYAVSLAGREREFASPPSVPDLLDYIATNYQALVRPQHYFGGWLDGGHYYLDCTVVVKDLDSALAMARANGQKAIYDLAEAETIYVRDLVPERPGLAAAV